MFHSEPRPSRFPYGGDVELEDLGPADSVWPARDSGPPNGGRRRSSRRWRARAAGTGSRLPRAITTCRSTPRCALSVEAAQSMDAMIAWPEPRRCRSRCSRVPLSAPALRTARSGSHSKPSVRAPVADGGVRFAAVGTWRCSCGEWHRAVRSRVRATVLLAPSRLRTWNARWRGSCRRRQRRVRNSGSAGRAAGRGQRKERSLPRGSMRRSSSPASAGDPAAAGRVRPGARSSSSPLPARRAASEDLEPSAGDGRCRVQVGAARGKKSARLELFPPRRARHARGESGLAPARGSRDQLRNGRRPQRRPDGVARRTRRSRQR